MNAPLSSSHFCNWISVEQFQSTKKKAKENRKRREHEWDNIRITQIWQDLLEEEEHYRNWRDTDCEGVEPNRPRTKQLRTLGLETRTSAEAIRAVVKSYNIRNEYAHPSQLRGLIEYGYWPRLAKKIVEDKNILNQVTRTHSHFMSQRNEILSILETFQKNYFESFKTSIDDEEGGKEELISFRERPERVAEAKERVKFREEEKKRREIEDAKSQHAEAQAIAAVEIEVETGTLDEARRTQWEHVQALEHITAEKETILKAKEKKLKDELKRSQIALI
jgi:hypothetical protein